LSNSKTSTAAGIIEGEGRESGAGRRAGQQSGMQTDFRIGLGEIEI